VTTQVRDSVALSALEGTNPIGFLAALGALSCLDRAGRSPTLQWVDDNLVPTAVVTGTTSIDELVSVIDDDRAWWASESITLGWEAMPDVKADPTVLHEWSSAVRKAWEDRPDAWRFADLRLWTALTAEGALAGKGNAKPTHLHFTAGQQQFLVMARTLAASLDADRIRNALAGPWRYEVGLPSFGWDARGERLYALRASDPSKEKRPGVPGADWLALLGLAFFPVAARGGRLVTTGCGRDWKTARFRWPLWKLPATTRAIAGLVGDRCFSAEGEELRRSLPRLAGRGVFTVLEAPIRRSDQGGYGSFGAPTGVLHLRRAGAGARR